MSESRPRHRTGSALACGVVGLGCVLVLAVYARSVSAGRLTHGFVGYHTAARLLLEDQMGAHVYDQVWFRDEVQRRTSSPVLEIFAPNLPTTALLAVPVAAFDVRTARAWWLLISLLSLAASAGMLFRNVDGARAPLLPIAVAVMLVSPPVFSNLRTGQAYLVIGTLFAAAAVGLSHRRDAMAGIFLGLAVTLKTAGVPWLLLLGMTRRWRALGAAIATVMAIGVVTLPWTGMDTWRAYPATVTSFVARPTTGLTAYQTTLGFMRHWCGTDRATPGMGGCETAASFIAWLLLAAAVVLTGRAVRNAPPLLASAAGACLSLLCIPIAEDHQFVLLAVPILVLTPFAGSKPGSSWWFGGAVAILVLVPAASTIERFTTGSLAWLAYPRLYAAWLLWALTIRAIYTSRANLSTSS